MKIRRTGSGCMDLNRIMCFDIVHSKKLILKNILVKQYLQSFVFEYFSTIKATPNHLPYCPDTLL